MVKRFFSDQDPIGQRLLIQDIIPGKPQLGPEIPWEIVGVIADERTSSLDGTVRPGVYVPIEQSPSTSVSVVVRSAIEPASLSRAITEAVHQVDGNQVVSDVRTLDQMKSESRAAPPEWILWWPYGSSALRITPEGRIRSSRGKEEDRPKARQEGRC